MSEEFYKAKYLIYKKKYLDLKKLESKLQMKGGSDKPSLVLFKADWCGHCNNFKPVWNNLKTNYKNINYQEFDADKDKQVMKTFKISGYPTLMFKKGGKMIEYKGMRDKESILSFIESKIN
jgi:protein disulfide-isomerase-like protein